MMIEPPNDSPSDLAALLRYLHGRGAWIEAWYPLANGDFECRIRSGGRAVDWQVDADPLEALRGAIHNHSVAQALPQYTCYVCHNDFTMFTDDPHTYHAEGCPLRDPEPHTFPSADDCAFLTGCGEDVHPSCCPTCTGQDF